MSNISHYTETWEVHPDLLTLPDNDKKDILTRELWALERCARQITNSAEVNNEISSKILAVQTILDNLW